MSNVIMKINLSPTKAGELYMKWSNLVEENKKLEGREKELLAKIGELELKIQSNILDNDGFGDSYYSD